MILEPLHIHAIEVVHLRIGPGRSAEHATLNEWERNRGGFTASVIMHTCLRGCASAPFGPSCTPQRSACASRPAGSARTVSTGNNSCASPTTIPHADEMAALHKPQAPEVVGRAGGCVQPTGPEIKQWQSKNKHLGLVAHVVHLGEDVLVLRVLPAEPEEVREHLLAMGAPGGAKLHHHLLCHGQPAWVRHNRNQTAVQHVEQASPPQQPLPLAVSKAIVESIGLTVSGQHCVPPVVCPDSADTVSVPVMQPVTFLNSSRISLHTLSRYPAYGATHRPIPAVAELSPQLGVRAHPDHAIGHSVRL